MAHAQWCIGTCTPHAPAWTLHGRCWRHTCLCCAYSGHWLRTHILLCSLDKPENILTLHCVQVECKLDEAQWTQLAVHSSNFKHNREHSGILQPLSSVWLRSCLTSLHPRVRSFLLPPKTICGVELCVEILYFLGYLLFCMHIYLHQQQVLQWSSG